MRRCFLIFAGLVLLAPLLPARENPEDTDLKTLRAAQVATDGPGLLDYFRRRTIGESERERIVALIQQLGDDSYAVRDRATSALSQYGLPAVGLLRQALNHHDVEISRRAERCLAAIEKLPSKEVSAAAARQLARLKPNGAVAVLLAYLPFADDDSVAEDVRESLAALAVNNGQPDPLLVATLDDPAPLKRGAAGLALTRHRIPAARKLLADPDADVRMRIALTAVGHAKDKAAVPTLINLLTEGPANQVWKAEELLSRLAGEQGPSFNLGRDADSRKKARDAWNEWWSKEGDKVDMAILDIAPKVLGLTLIVQANMGAISGKVYEINPAGEVQWKIDNLQQPYDAVVVGKDRVIIAEYSSSQITMRDFQGNIVWQKQFSMPWNLQVLPNNHLLVVARNQVVEWDQDRNEVFQLQRDRFDLTTAGKDRNGDYWLVTNSGNVIRMDRMKKELKSFPLGVARSFMGSMDLLPNGHILVSHQNGVSEFDFDGKRVWGATPTGQISSVQRLHNGNTLIAGTNDRSVIELDKDGKKVWDYKPADNAIPRKARRR
jgi:hypothetical protein